MKKRLIAMLLAVMMMTCCFVQAASATTYLTMAAVASSSGLFPYVVSIGKVLNTHGVRGEVKVLPWADGPEFLMDFNRVRIGGSIRISKKSFDEWLDHQN